eukprot:763891-Hanusia_phi.AAC.4
MYPGPGHPESFPPCDVQPWSTKFSLVPGSQGSARPKLRRTPAADGKYHCDSDARISGPSDHRVMPVTFQLQVLRRMFGSGAKFSGLSGARAGWPGESWPRACCSAGAAAVRYGQAASARPGAA